MSKKWKNNKYEGLEVSTFGADNKETSEKNDETAVETTIEAVENEVEQEKTGTTEEVKTKEKPAKKLKTVKAVVYGDFNNLNIRTSPEVANNIVATLPKGSEVEIIENYGDWSYIRFSAETGINGEAYAMTKFLKIKE